MSGEWRVFYCRFDWFSKEKVDCSYHFAEIIGLGLNFTNKRFPFLLHGIIAAKG